MFLAVAGVAVAAVAATLVPQAEGQRRALPVSAVQASPQAAALPGDDLTPTIPFLGAAGEGPEGQLIQAYQALATGQPRAAWEMAQRLAQEHPGFALAQLLYGDLLAARSGLPQAFGHRGEDPGAAAQRADLQDLREQALRRIQALTERPPSGQLPRELVDLPAHIKHAVAVDTQRSRLYLFTNGPNGLALERDFYVSLGKQGIGKQLQGDGRTPLGVYWITNALPSNMLDERFGRAALGLNYPNALDKLAGRTGTGLFLHGVPPSVYSHSLWATDGCVALANPDVEWLLKSLAVDDTPVVIARSLQWVPPTQTRQAAAEFRPAYKAWDEARRAGDVADMQRWYEGEFKAPKGGAAAAAPRGQVSMVAWYGEAQPVMVVTAREEVPAASGEAASLHRQYWVFNEGRWRIRYDGPVINTSSVGR